MAEGGGAYFRAVALASGHGKLLAAWTDAAGTVVQSLDRDGAPVSRAKRVGPAAESLDLAVTPTGFALGLLIPGHVLWGGGQARVVTLDRSGAPTGQEEVAGRAGVYSKGIAVANVRSRTGVVWQDGVPGDLAVMARFGGSDSLRLSPPQRNGCCPHIIAGHDGFLVAWGEYLVNGAVAEVRAQKIGDSGQPLGRPEVVVSTKVSEPWPSLVRSHDGYGMIYRDRIEQGRYDDLFFVRLDREVEIIVGPNQLGRYDGPTRGVLIFTGNVFFSVAVRSWARERILGLDRFTPEGERMGAELHIFFDHLRLTDTDALREGMRYLILYAEDNPRQAIWLSEITCR